MKPTRVLVVTGACLTLLLCACAGVLPNAPTWPVSPEPLPAETTSIGSEYGRASWALDPAYPAPGPSARELHVLVWELACSGGSAATGRMSAPVIVYTTTSVVVTIKVRPLGGVRACPGPPGTPALLTLSEPLGDRELYDGGREPPAPPSPLF